MDDREASTAAVGGGGDRGEARLDLSMSSLFVHLLLDSCIEHTAKERRLTSRPS